jgi:hypothetical protein
LSRAWGRSQLGSAKSICGWFNTCLPKKEALSATVSRAGNQTARDAYRKQTDKSASSERSVGAAVGWAQMSHPERLLDLLRKGSVSTDPSLRSSLAAPFAPSSFGSPWQIWLNSDYSGRTFYVTVPVDRPSDQRFQIRLRLVHWDWKLLALELPESTKAQLIEEFARMMDDRPSSPAR